MAVASLFEDLLDQYKIEQHIAEKRYTDLYQAYDVDDDRLVRLEILRADFAEDTSFAARFVNRARALAQVRHPNIAQVLHIGKSTGGAPYVAQAEVDGYPLSNRLEQLSQRNTPVNSIYALKLIHQVADALLLAERLEIFHYDLQPDNVLLKNVTLPTDENVVLIDLFIPAERGQSVRASAEAAEKAAYLSPEQRAGREVTSASHIYSLGAMLYRLLAGHLPGGSVTMQDTALSRVFGRATALERERNDLTAATYQLVDRSLRKDPRGRYADIGSFSAALDAALAAEEIKLGSAAGRAATVDRRPLAWFLPLLIVALFVAVGAVATRGLLAREGAPAVTITLPSIGSVGIEDAATRTASPTAEATNQEPAATIEIIVAGEPTADGATAVLAGQVESPTPEPSATATTTPTATPTTTPSPSPPTVRVMFNLVNLRRGPGIVYSLMGSVSAGESLEVVAWNNDEETPWFLVLTDDQRIGWIAASVVQADDSQALAAVPVAATFPPTPLPTATTTPTPTVPVVTPILPTVEPGDIGGGGATRPPVSPTEAPTEPPIEPSLTPPPLNTDTP